MKTVAGIIVALLMGSSCSNEAVKPEKSRNQENNNQVENFDVFFEKFSSDSLFQRSRIKFPLPVETYDIDLDSNIKSTMEAGKWDFFNIKELDSNYIITPRKKKDQNIINLQKKETGISVDYIFQKQGDKWIMVKIIDEST
jgi:hypothetical protein